MSDALLVMCWTVPIIIGLILERRVDTARHEREFDRVCDLAESSQKQLEVDRIAWSAERQLLLDRIQAPSFESYKQAEIKLTKVQNGVKDPPTLEQL